MTVRLEWETFSAEGRQAHRATYRKVVSFRIQKRGSLPSMIAYDLFEGGERVGSRRLLRDAKAFAEERLAEILAKCEAELREINDDLTGRNHVVDPWIRARLGRRRRDLKDALAAEPIR